MTSRSYRDEATLLPSESHGPVPLLVYSAGVQVVVAWLCLLGAYLSNGSSGITQFLAIVVGCFSAFELGIVVFVTQLIWLLADDEAEARSMPFIVVYVLISQSLLLLPVSIILTIWMIPLIVAVIVWLGWYFQRFTCFRLGSNDVNVHQGPLSLISILLLPMWGIVSGLVIAAPFLVFGASKEPGPFIITCTITLFLGALIPVGVAYSVLAGFRSSTPGKCKALAALSLVVVFAVGIETYTTGSMFWSIVVVAVLSFFFAGQWLAFRSLGERGIRVIRVAPTVSSTSTVSIKFEDVY